LFTVAKRRHVWVWLALVAAALAGLAVTVLNNFLVARHGAEEACAAYFARELGRPVSAETVGATVPEVYFKAPMQKRFRSTCKYQGRTVVMECSPFGEWEPVGQVGLD
jgi:hypothetical protein